jgi:arylsulfatase A-like enzyme
MRTVVIAAHGCPVWPLGAYGNEWIATPTLDRLAAEGVTFDRHYARQPDPLGGRADWWDIPVSREATPSADALGVASRLTGATLVRASRPAFDAPSHYYARFAEVFDARPESGRPPFAPLIELLPGLLDTLGDNALLWVETDRLIPPWFAPADVFEVYCEDLIEGADPDAEPLEPWADPPVGWFDRDDTTSWELLHRSYAAAVTRFDVDLGRVFDHLRAKGWDQTASWVFTSDFGYPLGHHGLLGPHRPWLHEEFVHVPLIVRRPNGAGAGERVWAFSQPADLVPLALGGEGLGVRGNVVSVAEIAGHREAALRTDTHALLLPLATPDDEPREPQLFEKPDDRWELNDVRQPNLALADELEAELRQRLE